MHYFDYQTASFPTESVAAAMHPYQRQQFSSLLSVHEVGEAIHPALDQAREHVRALLGATDEDAVLLAPSGAAAVNQIVYGVWAGESRVLGKNHYLASQNDEAAAILSIERLEDFDCHHDLLAVNDEGVVTEQELRRALTPRTALVSLSLVNGLTGVVQPLSEIASICRDEGVLLHIDLTHALTSLPIEVERWGIDFATFSGEQLHGPKGTGALFARRGLELSPLVATGQESICYSTQIPGALVGLGQAALETNQRREQVNTQVAHVRYRFEKELCAQCPEVRPLLEDLDRVPNIAILAFPNVNNEVMAYRLSRARIFATFGGGLYQQVQYLLSAMGIASSLAQCALSFSFSHLTSLESAIAAAREIGGIYRALQKLSVKLG